MIIQLNCISFWLAGKTYRKDTFVMSESCKICVVVTIIPEELQTGNKTLKWGTHTFWLLSILLFLKVKLYLRHITLIK